MNSAGALATVVSLTLASGCSKQEAKEHSGRVATDSGSNPSPDSGGESGYDKTYVYDYATTLIPAGSFSMGSPEEEPCRRGNEDQHQVTLTHDIWVGITEVTQGDFVALMGYNPSYFFFCGADCPLENVSWHEAALFLNAMSAHEGYESCFECSGEGAQTRCELASEYPTPYQCLGYRFPTEAEWEYFARAGEGASFSNGGDLASADDCSLCEASISLNNGTMLDDLAWFCGSSGLVPHDVASLEPNSWGLYDVHGDVREWINDRWSDEYEGDVTDPVGEDSGENKIKRGGSWSYPAERLRSAYRSYCPITGASSFLGVRAVRTDSGS